MHILRTLFALLFACAAISLWAAESESLSVRVVSVKVYGTYLLMEKNCWGGEVLSDLILVVSCYLN